MQLPRTRSVTLLLQLVLAAVGAACGGGGGSDAPAQPGDGSSQGEPEGDSDGDEAGGEVAPPGLTDLLALGFFGDSEVHEAIELGLSAALEAAFFVSAQNDATTITGTFTQFGSSWMHLPNPTDRMIVELQGAPPLTLTWTAFEAGPNVASAEDLLREHEIAGRLVVDGLMDLEFGSFQDTLGSGSRSSEFALGGVVELAGQSWTIQEERSEVGFFSADASSIEYESDVRTVGRYESGAQVLVVDRRFDYDSIRFDNYVEDVDHYCASTYTDASGTLYQFLNTGGDAPAYLRRVFVNARPGDTSEWRSDAILLRNGSLYAAFEFEPQVDESIDAVLKVNATGEELLRL